MSGERFKVFISWSGVLSKAVATVWRDLVKETFDSVDPFMSEEDIGAGERGLPKIASELAGTSFGIIVVTQENQNSSWVNYEAGALSKNVQDDTVRVAPSLVDFERKNDVSGPIGQFQANLLTREGIEAILVEISRVVDVDQISVRKRFSNSWAGEYEERFEAARVQGSPQSAPSRRGNDEILDELLTLVRDLARSAPSVRPLSELMGGGEPGRRPLLVLRVGDWVEHAKYGEGAVEEVIGDGESQTSLINFGKAGRVKLMHNHAPIQIAEPPF